MHFDAVDTQKDAEDYLEYVVGNDTPRPVLELSL